MKPNDQIQSSPSVSNWLKAADRALAERDVLDALRDAEALLSAQRVRARQAGITP